MRGKNRNSIEKSRKKLPQFTTMNVMDGQAGLVNYTSLIFYSLTIDNILNIIVLIILAGVSISMLVGDNGIITQAQRAEQETEEAQEKEGIELALTTAKIGENGEQELEQTNFQKAIDDQFGSGKAIVIDNGDGTFMVSFNNKNRSYKITSNGKVIKKSEIPQGLQVGSTVKYTANSNSYMWQGKYSGEGINVNPILNNTDVNYKITDWRVYNIDDSTGTIELISNNPTEGKVFLGYAQGYNNAVYLLNEACNELYGDSAKGIIGRNINIEDIEMKMTSEALNTTENSAHNYLNAYGYKYGDQANEAYILNASSYPVIYLQEDLSVIDGVKNSNGIKISNQSKLIEPVDTPTGKLQANNSIQPYNSYWYKDNEFMKNAFEPLNNNSENTYYDLIMPNGSNTNYWISTRVIGLYENSCGFSIRYVNSGNMGAFFTCSSYNNNDTDQGLSLSLRPLISVDASLITLKDDIGWIIE